MRICFLTKKEKLGVSDAILFTKTLTQEVDVYYSEDYKKIPSDIGLKNYDLIISYISPWIVPKSILKTAKKWNINFHPGSPDYPGIGCFNFALFDSANEFGATAHIMNPKVDSGKIIGVERFKISINETVETLSIKTYNAQLSLYKAIISYIIEKDQLPICEEKWTRKPYKRKELESLSRIHLKMSNKQIDKRIRATYYPGKPAPFIILNGHKFEYNPNR